LVYADVSLLGDNIDTVQGNTETLADAVEVTLEVNAERSKNMLVSRHQNASQNYDIKTEDRLPGNVSQLRYLVMTATNQNLIWEEILRSSGSGTEYAQPYEDN
jgi:hypothetical protein